MARRKSKKKTNGFCRPGVAQLDPTVVENEVLLAMQMSNLSLNQNVYNSFEDMKLRPEILKGIYNYGLEKPGPIQKCAIVPCSQGRDAIVQAQSGMGKTAALVISILQRLDYGNPNCQALVLVPTRELAGQFQKVFIELSKYLKVSSYSCVGGRGDMRKCKEICRGSPQVVIGTLGRTVQMIVGDGYGPHLSTDSLKILALDEADQMLESNNKRDLTTIFEEIPEKTQIILMSATMPSHTLKIAYRFMIKPACFLVRDFELTLDGIHQYHINVGNNAYKIDTLMDLFPIIEKARGMIFCNRKTTVVEVMRRMTDAGYALSCISGDMKQSRRDRIMTEFRQGEIGHRVIITSDLLGRGIDVQQINLVVNYDLPEHKEQYIHRVGRAGRFGRKGVALSFVNDRDGPKFDELKAFYHTSIDPMPVNLQFQQLLC